MVGIDMTDAQLAKARRLAAQGGFGNVSYRQAYIEDTGLEGGAFDCVISNGVINLAPDKPRLFREAARLLRQGGRLAIADIVTEQPLPEGVVCNADLWAACIGGAAQGDDYRSAIEAAGLAVQTVEENRQYQFISDQAKGATSKWGVKSVSILAISVDQSSLHNGGNNVRVQSKSRRTHYTWCRSRTLIRCLYDRKRRHDLRAQSVYLSDQRGCRPCP